jgi:hypothetical protein
MRGYAVVGCIVLAAACGGGDKKKSNKPVAERTEKVENAKPETEADREKRRRALAAAIIPEDSDCLPPLLKEDGGPRLELAAIGQDAVVCALDIDRSRLLGPIACWKVNLGDGTLSPTDPVALPGRGMAVMLDKRCARGYCLPDEAELSGAKIAHIAWNLDRSKAAVLAGDEVHLFDAASQDHESTFTIRGDKGLSNDPVAVHFVGESILVEGADEGPYSAVWVFKSDGTQVGPISSLGGKQEKPLSTYHGSLSILDKTRVGVAEKGMETLTLYDVGTGARAKLVRKVAKTQCKPAELDAFWHDGDKVSDKCRASIDKAYGPLIGATLVAGATNFLALLRGERLGELAVLDAKSLAEKKAIKLPWCAGTGKGGGDDADDAE